jgi:hypothetical protein
VLGHRPEFAPEPIHLVAPQAGRAGDEPIGGHQVRCALLVHVHAQPRILMHQRAGGAGVVEMDVRQ